MKIRNVAFIGAGNMGKPMAKRVRDAGFNITVCDVNPKVLEEFAKDGVFATDDPSQCSVADIVVVLLANDTQILETLIGQNGLTSGLRNGHTPLVCMMGTTLPETLQLLKTHFEPLGVRLIDAPVSGGIAKAESGTLTIMIGGEEEEFLAAKPLLETMGTHLFYCGELGVAEIVKVINNIICVANMFLTAEALEIARHYHLDLKKLSPILSVSTGLNFLTVDADMARAQYKAWSKSEDSYLATYNILKKDLILARNLASSKGLKLYALESLFDYVLTDDQQAIRHWRAAGNV